MRYVPLPKIGGLLKTIIYDKKYFQKVYCNIKLICYIIKTPRKELTMAIKHNGRTYYLVDVISVDEVIYEVYQDDYDNVIYKQIDTIY